MRCTSERRDAGTQGHRDSGIVKIPHDYHMHSQYSIDCQVPVRERCIEAIELGLAEICITDHFDLMKGDDGAGYYQPEGFFADVQRAREEFAGRVTLRAGIEIGEWHLFSAESDALTTGWPYDFVIGSLHWVGDEMILDTPYFERQAARDAYAAYYAELLEMVRHGGFDVIGHLDVPKRAGFNVYGGYDSVDYEEAIRAVLRAAIEGGIGIEINTGTARRDVGVPSPPLDVVRWYRELGGEIITAGSDSHRPGHMAYRFNDAHAMLTAAGFTHITCFEQRQPFMVPLG